jgi:hypothetical protein
MRSRLKSGFALFLITGLFISACGGETPIAPVAASNNDGKITEIITSLNSINGRLTKLEKTNNSKTDTNTPKASTPTVATPKSNSPETAKPTETQTTVTTPKSTSADDSKGRKILDKIVSTFNSANGIEMTYDKFEKNPATGKTRDTGTHLWAKNPDTILFELTRNPEDTGKVGTKIKYNVNDTKAKARATGIASITTVSLDFTDDRIVSPNGYLLNQADILSLMKRLKNPAYNGELIGKSTVNGSEVYMLKVTNKETNSMDSKIVYENIGFNPKDFTLRLWEAFSKDSDKPFLRVSVNKIQLLSSITEDQLKL